MFHRHPNSTERSQEWIKRHKQEKKREWLAEQQLRTPLCLQSNEPGMFQGLYGVPSGSRHFLFFPYYRTSSGITFFESADAETGEEYTRELPPDRPRFGFYMTVEDFLKFNS